MADAMITRSDVEYQALAWRVASAMRKAERAHMAFHGKDYGSCGWAYVVIMDKEAARYLVKHCPAFAKRPGGTAELRVVCGNWQSITAAEHVARAMADEFKRSGIDAYVYGRVD